MLGVADVLQEAAVTYRCAVVRPARGPPVSTDPPGQTDHRDHERSLGQTTCPVYKVV